MRKKVTVKQIQRLDDVAINQYGMPSLALMENAGRSVASEILKVKAKKVCIFCGLGNNAGDGFVVARHLLNAGVSTDIFLVGAAKRLKHDALVNYQTLKRLNIPIKEFRTVNKKIIQNIKKADTVVDAIFGVGLNRDVSDPFKTVIESVNEHAKKIIAVDIPSGLDGTTGKIYGVCIKAKKTVTFSFAKKGFFKNDGPKHAGKVVVVDIGIPGKLVQRIIK